LECCVYGSNNFIHYLASPGISFSPGVEILITLCRLFLNSKLAKPFDLYDESIQMNICSKYLEPLILSMFIFGKI